MNINPSQYLREIGGLFFCFYFVFGPDVAQASNFQKITQSLSDVHRSKVEKTLKFFEGVGILENLSQKEVRVLIHAVDDPTSLIQNSPSPSGTFGSGTSLFHHIKSRFFFSLFDLRKDSDALFTKLFSRKSGRKWEELPFEEAKRNWDNFLDEVRRSNRSYHTQIREIDLETAAINFIHQKFSDKYFPNADLFYGPYHPTTWDEQSLGAFFHNQFSIDHYINPYFTLTWKDNYYESIMTMIWKERKNFPLINSKKFVLKIWNDTTEEIRARGTQAISSFVFLELIKNSIIEFRRLGSGSHPFLEAMEEAAREDDHLARLINIVNEFTTDTSGNLEDYEPYILRQFIESSGLEENMIHDLLYHHDLRDATLPLWSTR